MISSTNLLLILVTIHLPFFTISMQTENGYLCNLCYSHDNEYPYPPPIAESRVVKFSKSEDEQFGMPWNRGATCIEIWGTVLDFANPNINDEISCRSMAKAYASQCCNEQPQDYSEEEQEGIEDKNGMVTPNIDEVSLTSLQQYEIVRRVSDESGEMTRKSRPSTGRLSTSSMGTGREIDDNAENDIVDRVSLAQPQSTIVKNGGSGARLSTDRLSSSTMGTGRGGDKDNDSNRNIRKTASVSYLRGKI